MIIRIYLPASMSRFAKTLRLCKSSDSVLSKRLPEPDSNTATWYPRDLYSRYMGRRLSRKELSFFSEFASHISTIFVSSFTLISIWQASFITILFQASELYIHFCPTLVTKIRKTANFPLLNPTKTAFRMGVFKKNYQNIFCVLITVSNLGIRNTAPNEISSHGG